MHFLFFNYFFKKANAKNAPARAKSLTPVGLKPIIIPINSTCVPINNAEVFIKTLVAINIAKNISMAALNSTRYIGSIKSGKENSMYEVQACGSII